MARKQGELPGMERPRIEELDAALEDFHEKTAALKAAKTKAKDAEEHVLSVAAKHGVKTYLDTTANPPLEFVLVNRSAKASVIVRAPEIEEEDPEEEKKPIEREGLQLVAARSDEKKKKEDLQ